MTTLQDQSTGVIREKFSRTRSRSGVAVLAALLASQPPILAQQPPAQSPSTTLLGLPAPPAAGPAPAPQQAPPPQSAPSQTETPPAPPVPPAPSQPGPSVPIALHLENADLLQVVSIIAAELRMNYVVDPQVKGTVNINTLGELRREDLFPLLQMVLRINGATAVQTGNFFRIVPLQNVQRMPLRPEQNLSAASLPPDDRLIMNIVPLKYVSAADMTKILTPFLSEGGHLFSHEAGNVLILTDSSRSMQRLMELVAQFDTEVFSNQRARLYPVKSSEASRLAEELRNVFSAYGLSSGASAIRFVPIERVNSILVVTPNPSVYPEVERWLETLDQPTVQSGVRTFVYKVENGRAEDLANVLSQLLLGKPFSTGAGGGPQPSLVPTTGPASAPVAGQPTLIASQGMPLGTVPLAPPPAESQESHIRIVPDTINNQILVQSTAQEFEEIRRTLQSLDIVPRQVMIEAKVFEVDLTGALSAGVSAFLQSRGGAAQIPGGERKLQGSFASPAEGDGPAALSASLGTLVGKTRELLLFLNAAESRGDAHVISAPSILASDNIPANINVGTEVPILTSQAVVGGAQSDGNSLFTNTIQNRDTGVLLTITPRVNSSGLVNLQIRQEVSAPLAPAEGGIQSPSIQKRSISTQVVVQDGETIALGGIIQESRTYSKNRVPLLGDIPYLGALFGNTALSTQRTELIVLLTPTVIRDTTEAQRATAEFRDKLRDLKKLLQQEEERTRRSPASDSPAAPPAP
ncbi:MAG TPA: type II secretion system secretin GspD [Terriglobia bacterium]|nr:type II secretion system secretin GspD [Terriglobia bacterium]